MRDPRLQSLAFLLASALGVVGWPRIGAGDGPTEPGVAGQAIERALCSPLAAVREAAVHELINGGETGRRLALELLTHAEPRLRAAALEVLAERAHPGDVGALNRALHDPAAAVGQGAGAALLACAARYGLRREPLLESLDSPHARQAMRHALVERLMPAGLDEVPAEVLALGEALRPALLDVLQDPGTPGRAWLRAVAASGRIGGEAVVQALTQQLISRPQGRWDTWTPALLQALVDAQPDPEGEALASLHVWLAGRLEAGGRWGTAQTLFPGWWSELGPLLEFAQRYPSGAWAELMREKLDSLLETMVRRTAFRPTHLLVPLVRLYCTLAPPSDSELEFLVRLARTSSARERRRWPDEGAEVLVVLEPYADRPAVRRGLTRLLEQVSADDPEADVVPETAQAWALYYLEAEPKELLRERARALLEDPGAAAPPGQRRLALELLARLGGPDAGLLREILEHADAGLRALALPWAGRRLPETETLRWHAQALAEEHEGGFLVGAECSEPADLSEAAVARLESMALGGGLAWRLRALAVLARRAGAPAPLGGPPLSLDRRRELIFAWREAARSDPAPALPSASGR